MAVEKILKRNPNTGDAKVFNSLTECIGAKQFISNETLLSPFIISSTALVTNLNADMLDGADLNDSANASSNVIWSSQKVVSFVTDTISGFSWQLPVNSMTTVTPPSGPAIGDRYIIPSGATGAWAGHTNEIAQWDGTQWNFTLPSEGFAAYVDDQNNNYIFNGTAWAVFGGIGNHEALINICGGDNTNGHWHLTQTELTMVCMMMCSMGTNTIDHEKLENLQGGQSGQHWHLSTVERSALLGGPISDAAAYHTHSNLIDTTTLNNCLSTKSNCNHTHAFCDLSDVCGTYTPNSVVMVDSTGQCLIFSTSGGTDELVKGDSTDGNADYLCAKIDLNTMCYDTNNHKIAVKPGVFAPASHNHDSTYYTQTCLSTPNSGATVDWTNIANTPTMSDCLVSLTSGTSANYLCNLIDQSTIKTDNGLNFICVDHTVLSQCLNSTYYTKTDLQTSGQAQVDFNNICGIDIAKLGKTVTVDGNDTPSYLCDKFNLLEFSMDLTNGQVRMNANYLSQCNIEDIGNVNFTNLTAGEYLYFDGSNWVNKPINLNKITTITYVDDSTGDDTTGDGSINNPYKTIMAAINASGPNTTIMIAPGTYTENITMNDGMTLFGLGGHVVIDGNITTGNGQSTALQNIKITAGHSLTINCETYLTNIKCYGVVRNNGYNLYISYSILKNASGQSIQIASGNNNISTSIIFSTIGTSSTNTVTIDAQQGNLIISDSYIQNAAAASTIYFIGNGNLQIKDTTILNLGSGYVISNDGSGTSNILSNVKHVGKIGLTGSGIVYIDNTYDISSSNENYDIGANVTVRRINSDEIENKSVIAGNTVTDAFNNIDITLNNKLDKISTVVSADDIVIVNSDGTIKDGGFKLDDNASSAGNILWSSLKVENEINNVVLHGDVDYLVTFDASNNPVTDKYHVLDGFCDTTTLWTGKCIREELDTKADKVTGGVENDFVSLDASGNIKDSGIKLDDTTTGITIIWSSDKVNTEINTKITKVASANENNIAFFDNAGEIKDSGIKIGSANDSSTIWTGDIIQSNLNTKADKITTGTEDNLVAIDASGNIKDSHYKIYDNGTDTQSLWTASKIDSIQYICCNHDVTVTNIQANQFLKYNGTAWINDTLETNDIGDSSNYGCSNITDTFNGIKSTLDNLNNNYIAIDGNNTCVNVTLNNYCLTHINELHFESGSKIVSTGFDTNGFVKPDTIPVTPQGRITSSNVLDAIYELDNDKANKLSSGTFNENEILLVDSTGDIKTSNRIFNDTSYGSTIIWSSQKIYDELDKKADHAYNTQYDIYNAYETIAIGDVLKLIYDSTNSEVRVAKADQTTDENVIGIAITGGNADDAIKVVSLGKVTSTNWTFDVNNDINKTVYLSTSGGVTLTAPTTGYIIPIGIVAGANDIAVMIKSTISN